MSKKGLGKGLQALIPTSSNEQVKDKADNVLEIDLKSIKANSKQPRQVFDDDRLSELASSIKEHGVVQPIIIRKVGSKYEIVAGERRWRAAQKLGFKTIPALIKDYSDEEVTEIALIENIQRENLNPVEEAQAYKSLIEQFSFTQEKLAEKLGKSRPYIANSLRILNLSPGVLSLLENGDLSFGHGRALLGLSSTKVQEQVAQAIVSKGLSVRETELLVKRMNNSQAEPVKQKQENTDDVTYKQIEEHLRSLFGTKVKISPKGKRGKIEIEYYGEEDLNRILELVLGPDAL